MPPKLNIIQVGLQEYFGPDGPRKLMDSLLSRYCPKDISDLPGSQSAAALQFKLREIKEARRQIALLFGLMETNQPVELITNLLANIDNATIASVTINDRGEGYSPGYGPPIVTFPEPVNGHKAIGRANLRPNGRILRVDMVNRGSGYSDPPKITFSPPKMLNEDDAKPLPIAKAVIFKGGKSSMLKGSIERIEIQEPGSGYIISDNIQVTISPPTLPNGIQAIGEIQ